MVDAKKSLHNGYYGTLKCSTIEHEALHMSHKRPPYFQYEPRSVGSPTYSMGVNRVLLGIMLVFMYSDTQLVWRGVRVVTFSGELWG